MVYITTHNCVIQALFFCQFTCDITFIVMTKLAWKQYLAIIAHNLNPSR